MAKTTKISASMKAQQRDNLNRHWRADFLATLAETSNVTLAAEAAGVPASRAYKTRRNEPGFKADWYAALVEGYEHLELEILFRLRAGTGKDDNKFDIANALRLLCLHRETVAQQRALRGQEDLASIRARLAAKIEAIRARDAKAVPLLLEDRTKDRAKKLDV